MHLQRRLRQGHRAHVDQTTPKMTWPERQKPMRRHLGSDLNPMTLHTKIRRAQLDQTTPKTIATGGRKRGYPYTNGPMQFSLWTSSS